MGYALCRRPPSDYLLLAGLLACWSVPPIFAPKIVKNMTECWPFLGFPPLPKTMILDAWRVLLGTFWHPGAPFC